MAVTKLATKSSSGMKGLISASVSESTMKGVGQELKVESWRLWRSTNYWLALGGLLSLLSSVPRDHLPRGGTVHSAMGSSTSTIIQ